MMRSRIVLLAVGLGVLATSCREATTPPKATILHESYAISKAFGDDSTAFAVYAAEASADTGSWAWTCRLWKSMRASLSATLGRLGYGTGPFTWKYGERERHALAAFQHDLGIRESGSLDSLTVYRLLQADSALDRPDFSLPSFMLYTEPGYVSVHGTLKALTNALAFPVNTVDIECNAKTGVCDQVSVDVISNSLNQLDRVRRTSYHITHWGGTDILAVGDDWPGSDCHATLSISIPSKDVTIHQWCTGDSTFGMFSHGPSEMTLKVVDGSRLAAPLDAGDLKDVHDRLYGEKKRYLALRDKNTIVQ